MTAKYKTKVAASPRLEWGYNRDPHDKDLLVPIEKDLDLLMQAVEHVAKGKGSLRPVAEWVSMYASRPLSYKTLERAVRKYKKNKDFLNDNRPKANYLHKRRNNGTNPNSEEGSAS